MIHKSYKQVVQELSFFLLKSFLNLKSRNLPMVTLGLISSIPDQSFIINMVIENTKERDLANSMRIGNAGITDSTPGIFTSQELRKKKET